MENQYDVIIIGSGLGGLECATILSKEGYKVCIVEQSVVFGGCLQSFTRKGRTIDTGIHYIGSMGEGQIMRQYLKYFGIFDKLRLMRLDDDFDVIRLADQSEYSYCHGYPQMRHALASHFPSEREGIEKYLNRIEEIGSSISTKVHQSGRFTLGNIDGLSVSVVKFIDECVSNPTLRSLLAGTNVLYGGVKESSNLYHHAMINHSNIEGSYRFVGGTQRVVELLLQQIEANGGCARNRSRVVSIDVDGAKVTSVTLEGGEKLYAKYMISGLHPASTFAMLGATPVIKKAHRTRLSLLPNTYGLYTVYLLMRQDGFPYVNKNYYYHSSDVWDTVLDLPDLMPKTVLLSSQPSAANPNCCEVVSLMAPINLALFERWSDTSPTTREEEYHQLKEAITTNIINYTAQFCPEIMDNIEHIYAASPLTYLHYTATPQGSAYGILKGYNHSLSTLIPTRTKLSNLFLTGQNLNVHGALGVSITAASTCAELLGTEYLAKKIGNI